MKITKHLWLFQAALIVVYTLAAHRYFVLWCAHYNFAFTQAELVTYTLCNLLLLLIIPAINQFYLIDKLIKAKFILVFIAVQIVGLYITLYLNAALDTFYLRKYNLTWLMSSEHFYSRVFINLAFIGLLGVLKFISNLYIRMNSEKVNQINQLESDIKLLRSQINPHFLFNSLNNIYSYSIQKKDETPELILKLSHILRFLSDSKSKTFYIDVHEEIKVCRALVDLYLVNKRWIPKINFEVKQNQVQGSEFYIEPHSLLTLVENIFKHCNLDEENAFAKVIITLSDNTLECITENTIRTDRIADYSGTGLSNLEKRLKISYKTGYTFHSYAEKNIFRVHFKVNRIDNKMLYC
jgi:sensor histidine kinase YesM